MGRAPSAVGAIAESAVAAALVAAGREVYFPFVGSSSRVDLVFQDESGFNRVQCKTSQLLGEVVRFRTCSNTKNIRKDYRGEVDLFGVYSPELGQVFLVPVEDVPARMCHLRLRPSRNGQIRGIRWARDYLLSAAGGDLGRIGA